MGNIEPTSADIAKLTSAVKDVARAMNALGDGVRAANTNLVAIHEVLKEKEHD